MKKMGGYQFTDTTAPVADAASTRVALAATHSNPFDCSIPGQWASVAVVSIHNTILFQIKRNLFSSSKQPNFAQDGLFCCILNNFLMNRKVISVCFVQVFRKYPPRPFLNLSYRFDVLRYLLKVQNLNHPLTK